MTQAQRRALFPEVYSAVCFVAAFDFPAADFAAELCAWTGVALGGAKVPSAPQDGDNPEQCVSAAQPPSLSPSPPSVLGPDLVCLAGPATSQFCRALHPLKTGAAGGTCRSAKRAPLASMPFSSLLTCSGLALFSRAYFEA